MNDGVGEHADTEMMARMDVLQTLRVDDEDANGFAAKVIRTSQRPAYPSFVEAYGTGRIVENANGVLRRPNVKGLAASDLRTRKPTDTPWALPKPEIANWPSTTSKTSDLLGLLVLLLVRHSAGCKDSTFERCLHSVSRPF